MMKNRLTVTGLLRMVYKTPLALSLLALSACNTTPAGPDYVKPPIHTVEEYKGSKLWKIAAPGDEYPVGEWWKVYRDQHLNELMEILNKQNLNIALAEAQYRQADALLRQAQVGNKPSVSANASVNRGDSSITSNSAVTTDALGLSASWTLDLWGGVRRQIEAGQASLGASKAQIQAMRLSAQAQMVTAYLQLVVADQQIEQLRSSASKLENIQKLTRNQYKAGIISEINVAQAESAWNSAMAQLADKQLTRDQLEHAVAVTLGRSPAELTIPNKLRTMPHMPVIPASIPSTLLERRPDIAVAERNMAAANAKIGVAKAAYYPDISLSASIGQRASSLADILSLPNRIWSLGPQLLLSVLDFGLRDAQAEQAIAAYDVTVANYKQTVLSAFQAVEDNLTTQAVLREQAKSQTNAMNAAKRAEEKTMNQYKAGIVSYLNVLTAQNARISAENAWWNVLQRQYTGSVALIAGLGGQW